MIELYNQDCMSFMATMKNNHVIMTLTDIPYGEVNRASNGLRTLDNKDQADNMQAIDLDKLVDEIIRVTEGSIYMFCGINQISTINSKMRDAGLSTRLCVWEKTNPSPMNGEHIWESGVEACVFGKKKGATFHRHCKNTVWKHTSEKNTIHPTQKPLKLFEYLVESSSNTDDLIFDPFSGSATTGVAAKRLSRQFIGCEIFPEYFTLAQARLDATIGDNDPFSEFTRKR